MSRKLTTPQFIEKANVIHNNKYNYSLVKYTLRIDCIDVICAKHGVFTQLAGNHLNGKGCSKCAIEERANNSTSTTHKFIEKSKKLHCDKYDYSLTIYINAKAQVIITCFEHGNFSQPARSHLRGAGCQKCALVKLSDNQKGTKIEFISKATSKHNGVYSYKSVKYSDSKNKVLIECSKHGLFSQTPNDHLNGKGCYKCSRLSSKPEVEIANHIRSLGITVKNNVKGLFNNKKYEADLLIESKKIVIEYDGSVWHSERFHKNKHNILDKTIMANNAGYRCIHIREDQYINNKEVVLSLISSALGVYLYKTGARKTIKKQITNKEYKYFCESNHLQGWRPASIKLGLFIGDNLIACIGYNKLGGELVRYVVKNGWSVSGALPKLIKGESVKYSYCDLSFFTGVSYIKAGFKFKKNTKPNYLYEKSGKVVTRIQRQKHKLQNIFNNCDIKKTEVEINKDNGWYRLFDCGSALYYINK